MRDDPGGAAARREARARDGAPAGANGRRRARVSAVGPVANAEDSERWPLRRVLDEEGEAAREVGLSGADLLELHRWMVLNRTLDERMVALQRQGRIGFYVGSVGEEAAVLGAARAMSQGDWIFPSYREHGVALMRGMPLVTFICDLLGNAGDAMLGHQMPCHEAWRPAHFTSISSPIGTQLTHAVGAAWAARLRGDAMVALAYLGEGATSSNDFHASLNLAALHRVPVIFACRNNGWAISLPRERQTASATIAQKADAYGLEGERVDGNDLLAVYEATARARARALAGSGPTLLELVTYRMEGHSTSDDPRAYRPPEQVAPWRARDPILRLRAHLVGRGLLGPEDGARVAAEARERVAAAVREAEAFPAKPELETLFEGVYAAPLRPQQEQLEEIRRAVAADPRVADPRGPRP